VQSKFTDESESRHLGIDILDAVPWGTHICQFYDVKQDLIDVLVPYFQAGLENNEYCICITSEILTEKEAEEALREAISDFPQYLASRQIEIIPATEWYLQGGTFDGNRVLNAWIDKLKEATSRGYDGLRLSGDASWLESADWNKFTDYEEEIDNTIDKYRMLAICTYPLHKYGASEIMDVECNHQYSFTKREGKLVLIGGTECKRLEDEVERIEEKYHILFQNMLNGFAYCKMLYDENDQPIDFIYLDVNDAFQRITGIRKEDVINKKVSEVIPGIKEANPEIFSIYGKVALTGKPTVFDIYLKPLKIALTVSVYSHQKGYFIAVFENIIKRKQVENKEKKILRIASGKTITPLQKKFIREGLKDMDESAGIRLILNLCRYRPECDKEIKKCVKQFKTVRVLLAASDEELQQSGICPRGLFTI